MKSDAADSQKPSASWTGMSSFVASGLAEFVTVPIDVTKVRLQVQKSGGTGVQYTGMVNAMTTIVKNEGPTGLFKGLAPALTRQCCYTSLMMVLFPEVKSLLVKEGEEPGFAARLAAGGTAGAIGITIMNPTEILKTQMQTATTGRQTMLSVARTVYANEGLLGFWAGVQPNVMRCFLVNAAELGTYDQAKSEIQKAGLFSNYPMLQHISASGIAGFTSACISTPADVVKTRLMNQAGHIHAYNGMLHCFVTLPKQEGVSALYKGFVPILARKLLWCTAFFVTYEQIMNLE